MSAWAPSLRARVALALALVVVPIIVGFVAFSYRLRRDALLETTYESVVSRMENGGRERCEAHALEPARDRRDRRERRRERRAMPVIGRYDAALRPADPAAPRLPDDVASAFAEGEPAVLVGTTRAPQIALRMPWDEGPCAVVVVAAPRAIVAAGFARDLGFAMLVLLLSVATAMLALGPPLARLGQLSSAVKKADDGAIEVPPTARGPDEIGVLASALAESAARARAHVAALEARDRALREYVDGTTHDLALPLTVIQGHLASLAESAERGAPADVTDVRGATASAHYLFQLAANLAAAARLEGGAAVEHRPVDLGALVERVVARLAPIARHRGVELAVALPDVLATIEGDELLLERALANLVHNAIRHRPAGVPGHVAVLVGRAPLGVVVKSDGTPIDDASLAALRDGSVPSDVARTRGRGLGLSIVRKVAALHGLSLAFDRGEAGALEVTLRR